MPQKRLKMDTSGPGLYEFTQEVRSFVRQSGVDTGLLTAFVRHTSCSLLIQENADPDVQRDLNAFLRRLVPPSNDPSMKWVTHTMEGPDDMPAHIKAALLPTSLQSLLLVANRCWEHGRAFTCSSTAIARTDARLCYTSHKRLIIQRSLGY